MCNKINEILFSSLKFSYRKYLKIFIIEASLVVQWLRLCFPVQGVQVPSLVGEPHALEPKNQNRNRSSIVTKSVQTLKKWST